MRLAGPVASSDSGAPRPIAIAVSIVLRDAVMWLSLLVIARCAGTLALTSQPPLSSIALKASDAARLAVRIVVEGQVREMLTAQRIALHGELVERATVGPNFLWSAQSLASYSER